MAEETTSDGSGLPLSPPNPSDILQTPARSELHEAGNPAVYYPWYPSPLVLYPAQAATAAHSPPNQYLPPLIWPIPQTQPVKRAPSQCQCQIQDSELEEEGIAATRRPRQTVSQKVNTILDLLKTFKWTIGDFLYHLFAMQDSTGKAFDPTPTHYQMISKFLTGETSIPVAKILDMWLKSSYGLPDQEAEERKLEFSTTVNYLHIKYARPAITSFAAQIVRQELVKEADRAVQSNSGLHTFTTRGEAMISRYDLGADSFLQALDIFQENMPLTWRLLLSLAASYTEAEQRKKRPPELVSYHIIPSRKCEPNLQTRLFCMCLVHSHIQETLLQNCCH